MLWQKRRPATPPPATGAPAPLATRPDPDVSVHLARLQRPRLPQTAAPSGSCSGWAVRSDPARHAARGPHSGGKEYQCVDPVQSSQEGDCVAAQSEGGLQHNQSEHCQGEDDAARHLREERGQQQ